jgi:hypothetical protein
VTRPYITGKIKRVCKNDMQCGGAPPLAQGEAYLAEAARTTISAANHQSGSAEARFRLCKARLASPKESTIAAASAKPATN